MLRLKALLSILLMTKFIPTIDRVLFHTPVTCDDKGIVDFYVYDSVVYCKLQPGQQKDLRCDLKDLRFDTPVYLPMQNFPVVVPNISNGIIQQWKNWIKRN